MDSLYQVKWFGMHQLFGAFVVCVCVFVLKFFLVISCLESSDSLIGASKKIRDIIKLELHGIPKSKPTAFFYLKGAKLDSRQFKRSQHPKSN